MHERVFLNTRTIFAARIEKNRILRNAQTTANTQNKQVSVLRSKYPKYSLSGGTINEVITAAKIAMHKTAFFLINAQICSKTTPW